jgi:bacillithiol biosynthesis cysteine-adding enzyme BshC
LKKFSESLMPTRNIPYKKTGYFSELICDYLDEKENLQPFYTNFPRLENFQFQLQRKAKDFDPEQRKQLAKCLLVQYEQLSISKHTLSNIDLLKEENTFTITTGHQLNLFTGPLYFLYKIINVINLSEQLKKTYPKYNFVPVYWMATEDHDFEEINYFNIFRKKVKWDRDSGGAVGKLSTEGTEELVKKLKDILGNSANARSLTSFFAEAYTKQNTLADATRYLANQLFSEYGLVIIDGNEVALKNAFNPFAEKELLEQRSFKEITATTEKLTGLGYPEQVHPREINLFYLKDGMRERIIERKGVFYINDTEISFSRDAMLAELHTHPERFSPNALLRPLYQEVILPNICYIGGGGELAYWFQLKDYFEKVGVPFPLLLLRNSVLLVPSGISEKIKKKKLEIEDFFLPQHELKTLYTRRISDIEIDFSTQRKHLQQQFKALYELAKKTDASFMGAVGAQEKKQMNGLDRLEKRLMKAQQKKMARDLERIANLQEALFPGQSLQERVKNFSEIYLEQGEKMIPLLKSELDPLSHEFTILELPS